MAKVAFLGLGVMGFPMAGHLVVKGGHDVTVFNRTPAKAKAWAEKFKGRTAPTPKAAAEGQDFVMACVGNDNDLRAITLGAEGAYAADADTLAGLDASGQVVLRYAGDNPNGSAAAIAGVCNADGNVVGLMPHPEHAVDPLTGPSADGLRFFASVVARVAA